MRKLTSLKRKRGRKPQLDEAVQRAAVYDYDVAGLSLQEVMLKYGLKTRWGIYHWRAKYSSDIIRNYQELQTMTPAEEQHIRQMEEENRKLKESLQTALLKVTGLETMIDIAEKELGVNIRKKSGAKQPNT